MSVHAKLAQARAIVKPVVKSETADAGKYEYSYASLSSVLRAVDEACNEVGLTWWQEAFPLEGLGWQLFTVLYDDDGDDLHRFGGAINTTKADPQQNGSALTYARRYSLVLLFGMNQTDDDGGLAHRAVVSPDRRTEAEGIIRDGLAALTRRLQAGVPLHPVRTARGQARRCAGLLEVLEQRLARDPRRSPQGR